MIRQLMRDCADSKIIQNLNCDLWISSVQSIDDILHITVFNRLFTDDLIEDLVLHVDGERHACELNRQDAHCYSCQISHGFTKCIYVQQYRLNGKMIHCGDFLPYRVEKDMLRDDECVYLRNNIDSFEVMPSFSLKHWQCACSYVNADGVVCKRCGKTKYENQCILNEDYHLDMYQSLLSEAVGNSDALVSLSERFGIALEEVLEEAKLVGTLAEETLGSRPFVFKKVYIFLVVIVIAIVVAYKPVKTNIQVYRADSLVRNGDYEQARDLYREYLPSEKADEKVFESLILQLESLKVGDEFILYSTEFFEVMNDYYWQESFPSNIITRVSTPYIERYLEEQNYEMALVVSVFLCGYEKCMREEQYQSLAQDLIDHEEYMLYMYFHYYFPDSDLSELNDVTMKYIDKILVSQFEVQSAPELIEIYQYNAIWDRLNEIVLNGCQECRDYAYKVMYNLIVTVGPEYENRFVNEISILYSANFLDARDRFKGDDYNIVHYSLNQTVQPQHTVDAGYFRLLVSKQEPDIDISLEIIGTPVSSWTYSYSTDSSFNLYTLFLDEHQHGRIVINTKEMLSIYDSMNLHITLSNDNGDVYTIVLLISN